MTILAVEGKILYIYLTWAPKYGGRIPDDVSIVANLCLCHNWDCKVTFGTVSSPMELEFGLQQYCYIYRYRLCPWGELTYCKARYRATKFVRRASLCPLCRRIRRGPTWVCSRTIPATATTTTTTTRWPSQIEKAIQVHRRRLDVSARLVQ